MNAPFLAKFFKEPSFFSEADRALGKKMFQEGRVENVLFSEGTYQVEVFEEGEIEPFWPFLQLDEEGKILDHFCTCEQSEKEGSCFHLAAAYYRIYNCTNEPLHVRFHKSFWNEICQMYSKELGYETKILDGTVKKGYEIHDQSNKVVMSFRPLNKAGEEQLDEIINKRTLETEETSLKFSNLSAEDLKKWREKRPSHHLRYELSFWSDLAKWLLSLQDQNELSFLRFERAGEGLPSSFNAELKQIAISGTIFPEYWPEIIPSLAYVESNLQLFDLPGKKIEKIIYDVEKRSLRVDAKILESVEKEKRVSAGAWIYIPGMGFYPSKQDPLLDKGIIKPDEIADALDRHPHLFFQYLPLIGIVPLRYSLFFDSDKNLYIESYLFEKGDLKPDECVLFGNWVYFHPKGFYQLSNALFSHIETIVPKEKINQFINRYRSWFNEQEGFHIQSTSIEAKLSYEVTKAREIKFFSEMSIKANSEEVIDFGPWVYLAGGGFYPKGTGKMRQRIQDGLVVPPDEVLSFITANQEELENISGFFSEIIPIKKLGLYIGFNAEEKIVVTPHYQFLPEYNAYRKEIFDDFIYVEEQGFSQISKKFKIPGIYAKEQIITEKNLLHFLTYELDILQPFVLAIDRKLRKPKELFLRIKHFRKDPKAAGGRWIVGLEYGTDLGVCSAYEAWKAIMDQEDFLYSLAGLVFLKSARFSWLKKISSRKWLEKGESIRLSTLEWLKLCAVEDIREPAGNMPEEVKTRKMLEEFNSLQSSTSPDLTGLISVLRPYQDMGVRWLWFLYTQELSGLLCDEMGLGKTHQAMALLAAISNSHKTMEIPFKAFVVCPTSVIIHWEELLKRFFPQIRVKTFHGIERTLDDFIPTSDLLLTSYGTLRREYKEIKKIKFDIAIYDEIQIAKNIESLTHRSLRQIDAKMRLGLTGTPIENNLSELRAIFELILPAYFPAESVFKANFIAPIEKHDDPEAKKMLNRLITPFILRRKKENVLLELPEKTEEISYCLLSDEQKELYQKFLDESKMIIMHDLEDEKKMIPYIHVFALLSKLKQVCNHPCLITKNFDRYEEHQSGKWELFKELLQESRDSGLKLVVFSQYLGMLDLIELYLTQNKIGFAGIRGTTRDRKTQLDRFRDDPKCEVFVASLQAAGVGIDLVSASVVIHYDRWWNPAKENQATDRVHRIGQSRGVQVFKMVTRGTIEENIFRLIEKKKGLAEGVIGYDDQDQMKKLTRHDLVELLRMTDFQPE
jgi:superfamily II DNA or RNA helicase